MARARFLSDNPICSRCDALGYTVLAGVVHHVTPHKGDEALFHAPDNLQALCKTCHDGPVREAELRGYETTIGVNGFPIDPRHPANK